MKKKWKKRLHKVWFFIWEDDSPWSWIVNIILAFVLIKFIIYPSLGFVLQTTHPVVAVVSESMEHKGNFDEWWDNSKEWYVQNGISKEDFHDFVLRNGFNKGDIMFLRGKPAEDIEIGEVIVFWSARRDPIIHRVVKKWTSDGDIFLGTKGDNYETNSAPIKTSFLDETQINEQQLVGTAAVRIPLLGYIKIWFVEIIDWAGVWLKVLNLPTS
jgi:signal peptidase I